MKRLLGVGFLLAALALGACLPVTVDSGSGGAVPSTMPGQDGGGLPPGPADPTAIILPDGNECLWAGEGATLAFDGERVNYTCSTENTVLIGDPVQDEETVWTVTVGTLDGTELASSEEVTFQLNELDLVDGSVCLHAGRGATMAFEEGRLNWSCGEDAQGMYGVFGALQPGDDDEPGAYYAIKILFTSTASGFAPQTTFRVPVTTIVGSEVALTPGEIAMQQGTPTTIILPDGNECLWAGEGATLAFDGERVNYTCSTENTVLIGDPVQDEETVWTVTVGTLDGTALASSEEVTFQLNELDLANGAVCLHAGRGATFGIEGERVNWTCGEENEAAAAGALTTSADTPGIYFVTYATVVMGDGVPPQGENPESVAVATIVGSEVQLTPGEIAMATAEATSIYTSPAGYSIAIPGTWVGHYTVDEFAGDEALAWAPLAQNVTQFLYTPVDPANARAYILTIYTFTEDDWATVSAEAGPPLGDVVLEKDGLVYVAATPQSNPYADGTEDADTFNTLVNSLDTAIASIE